MKIHIPIKPMPAPRPRVTSHGTYNDPKYTQAKNIIGLCAKRLVKRPYEAGTPVGLKIDFFFQIPRTWTKAKKEAAKWHVTRPDADNLSKTVKDALNGILYHDDSQVCWIQARKQYAAEDGIVIEVVPLT